MPLATEDLLNRKQVKYHVICVFPDSICLPPASMFVPSVMQGRSLELRERRGASPVLVVLSLSPVKAHWGQPLANCVMQVLISKLKVRVCALLVSSDLLEILQECTHVILARLVSTQICLPRPRARRVNLAVSQAWRDSFIAMTVI